MHGSCRARLTQLQANMLNFMWTDLRVQQDRHKVGTGNGNQLLLPGDNLKSLHCFKNSLGPTNNYESFQAPIIISKIAHFLTFFFFNFWV